jgi:23S rRNA (uridine2552-2'-O)-methyltransferase
MAVRRSGGGGAPRDPAVRVKTARRRKASSTHWLRRQLNDPYVAEAKRRGYRSRAAFKLIEIDDRFHLLGRGARVVDLGAAPGGWSQVAAERVGDTGGGLVVAVDLAEMDPIAGVTFLLLDFTEGDAPEQVAAALGGPVDLVLSDMAAPATGHASTDHLRIMALCEAALDFAAGVLKPGGGFVAKVLQGGTERGLLQRLKRDFAAVRHVKPPASRKESAEMYVVATGFRGG